MKIAIFIKKVCQNSFSTKKIVHDFSIARFRAKFFYRARIVKSCTIFFVISNPGRIAIEKTEPDFIIKRLASSFVEIEIHFVLENIINWALRDLGNLKKESI